MISPYDGFENATLIFEVPTNQTTVSTSGNVVPVTQEFEVEAFVFLADTKAEKNKPKQAGEGAIGYEGYAVKPMLFHPDIKPGMEARAVIDGLEGLFILDVWLLNPPHGRTGMGAIIEQEQGTKFSGWLRLRG